MIDIQLVRENPELVEKKAAEKGYKIDVSKLLELDKQRRELLKTVEELREKRNQIAETMKNSGGKPNDDSIRLGREIKIDLTKRESYLEETERQWQVLLHSVPNLAFDDVPLGDEHQSLEVGKFGDQQTGAEDHLDFMNRKGWIDFERGAKVSGAKFYFLKNDAALLEDAIKQYGLRFVMGKGFNYMTVPHIVNSKTSLGAGFAPKSSKESNEYFIEGEDLALIGTSEAPLTGYHADEIIDETDLPLLYIGYSPCYRKEAGTYGKHTRGLFRVHQFNKLEMYAFTTPENSLEMHEKIRQIEEELWQSMGIPYRVINIASGDLGAPAAKKYDLEYWSKVDGAYRELTSCSNCTDYQARNLNIRVRRGDGRVEVLHTLNGTAVALARSLIAIIEHYQTEDGNLRVPEVLQPYMDNRQII